MSDQTHIIAEMACSHEGDPDRGRTIIDGASEAGADSIQFQIWKLDAMVVPHHEDYDILSDIELTYDQWRALAEHVRSREHVMDIIACVYEKRSVDFGEDLGVEAYKIHSSDLSNPYLIKCVAETGKRIDLSVGGSTLDEIQTSIQWIEDTSDSDIWLMYGYQDFPTRVGDVHMDYMMKLRNLFERPIGYQDHSAGASSEAFWLPAAAVGAGVDVLEKHITHNRSFEGLDHEAALNPDEFSEFVRMVRQVETAKGTSVPRAFSEDEKQYRRDVKKSLVASQNLEEGDVLTEEDLDIRRANDLGLPPDRLETLVGQKIRRDIDAFHLIQANDLA
ncbi:sialic acid synthase SpsE [Salinibacter ruber]|uniref:Sialic acid synthase SpsE n=1 Tax=Salinibacter ruber TaxID=146919 RepID=A0A9X2Q379_9BACT|nr:N-acetylneuraminate synthase family protein [Salinibacter ruber]MCS3677350.1 sialic acid synthase SpsE [Salinibacter ruber]MCS3680638.1 sialic acid synthase SpsE [Salinibacter ruber]